jgi:hypothetical protein
LDNEMVQATETSLGRTIALTMRDGAGDFLLQW